VRHCSAGRLAVTFLAAVGIGVVPVWETAPAGLSEAAVSFLVITNSARANGMGGCSINLVDGMSALYNPGAIGLYHTEKVFSASLPDNTQWLPNLADDLRLKTYSLSAGVPGSLLLGKSTKPRAALAVAYSRHRLNLGAQTITGEFGNILGTFETWEKADYYTLAVGLRYYARLGVGITYKRLTSHLADFGAGQERGSGTANGTALDYGILAELPILDLLPHDGTAAAVRPSFSFELTPSVAYVYANSGDEISYIDASQADPLPEMARMGLSVYGAVKFQHAVLISTRLSRQRDDARVGASEPIRLRGLEVGFLGAAFVRTGRVEDEEALVFFDTEGYGFSLAGLLAWLPQVTGRLPTSGTWGYLLSHADLTYDWAKYKPDDKYTPLEGTKFVRLSLSF